MSRIVALCIDKDSFQHPEFLGLDGESLQQQDWLEIFESGIQARFSLQDQEDVHEVWVASSNDVEPINLAASLKQDRHDLIVKLIAPSVGGSLRSRANNAGIDEVLELSSFVKIYTEMKHKALRQDASSLAAPILNIPDPRIDSGEHDLSDTSIQEQPTIPFYMESLREGHMPLTPSDDGNAFPDTPEGAMQTEGLTSGRARKGFLMSIVSGSGGSGKSTVAVLAALDAAEKGYRTLLLDCDLQFGDVAYDLRKIPSTTIDRILHDSDQRIRVFNQDAPLVVLGAPDRFEISEVIGDHIADLTEEATRYFDVVVVNTGANWSEQHAVLLEQSSVALFLVDQRGSSLRACGHALELCARCGIASVPFKLALNRCSKTAPFSASKVARIFKHDQVFELKDGGDEVEEYLASGNAFELRGKNNDLVASIDHMMLQLLPQMDSSLGRQSLAPSKLPRPRKHGFRASNRRAKVAL